MRYGSCPIGPSVASPTLTTRTQWLPLGSGGPSPGKIGPLVTFIRDSENKFPLPLKAGNAPRRGTGLCPLGHLTSREGKRLAPWKTPSEAERASAGRSGASWSEGGDSLRQRSTDVPRGSSGPLWARGELWASSVSARPGPVACTDRSLSWGPARDSGQPLSLETSAG